jgi:HEAT repeat protein
MLFLRRLCHLDSASAYKELPMPKASVLPPLSPQVFAELGSDAPSATEHVLQGLAHADWQMRRAAVATVSRWVRAHSLTAAVEHQLLRGLVDGLGAQDNAGLRNGSAQAIAAMGNSASKVLREKLAHADVDQRKFIIEALGASGAPHIRLLLVGLLESEITGLDTAQSDSNIRSALIEALGHYASEQVQDLLFKLAQAPNATLQDRASALHTLSVWQAHLPLEPLLALLPIPGLHRALYPLLGLTQNAEAIATLMQASVRGSLASRREACVALASLWLCLGNNAEAQMRRCLAEHADASDIWVQNLDQTPAVVDASVRLLGLCDCRAIIADIMQACADKGQAQAAIDCMLRQGRAAVPGLLATLAVRDTQTQLLCLDAIEAIGDPSAIATLVAMLGAASKHVLSAVVRALGVLGGPEEISVLVYLVRNQEDAEVARQVVWALSQLAQRHPANVAEQMRQALARGDVQPTWLRVLGAMGQAEDLPLLLAGLGHQDAEVRVGVLEAAAQMRSQLPEKVVLASLGDAHPEVRLAAAKLLRGYSSEAVFEGLMRAMHDEDAWVVAEAARALGHLQKPGGLALLQRAATVAHGPVAVAALESLAHFAPDNLAQIVHLAIKHVDAEVVCQALQLAAQLDRTLAQQTLCEALAHPAWDVRAAAADLLLRKRWLPSIEAIERAIERESEPLVQQRLQQLYSRLGPAS